MQPSEPMPARKRKAKRPAGVTYPSETFAARKERGRPQATFSLPQVVVDELDAHARESGRSKSEIVATALTAYLERQSRA